MTPSDLVSFLRFPSFSQLPPKFNVTSYFCNFHPSWNSLGSPRGRYMSWETLILCFWAIPNDTQNLLLSLCSGINPGGVEGPYVGAKDWYWTSRMQSIHSVHWTLSLDKFTWAICFVFQPHLVVLKIILLTLCLGIWDHIQCWGWNPRWPSVRQVPYLLALELCWETLV